MNQNSAGLKAKCEFLQSKLAQINTLWEHISKPIRIQTTDESIAARQNVVIHEYNRVMAKTSAIVNYRYAQIVLRLLKQQ